MNRLEKARDDVQATARTAGAATRRVARRGARRAYGPAQFVIPFLVGGLGALLGVMLLNTGDHVQCSFAQDYLPDWTLYLLGVVAFFGGHLLGDLGAPNPTRRSKGAQQWGRAMRVSGLGILGLVSIFEAFGVAEAHVQAGSTVAQLEPITYYTRCAIYYDISSATHGVMTVAVITLTFFLAGHWLWGARPESEA